MTVFHDDAFFVKTRFPIDSQMIRAPFYPNMMGAPANETSSRPVVFFFDIFLDFMEDFLGILPPFPVPQAAVDDGHGKEDDGQSLGMAFHHDQVVPDEDFDGNGW